MAKMQIQPPKIAKDAPVGGSRAVITCAALMEPRFTREVEEKIAHISAQYDIPVLELKHRFLRLAVDAKVDIEHIKRGSLGVTPSTIKPRTYHHS